MRVSNGAVIGVLVAARLTSIDGNQASANLAVAIPSSEVAKLADEHQVAWASASA